MVKHIVMFQLTQEAKDIGRDIIIDKLRLSINNMNGKIPGLIQANLFDNNMEGSHDIALFAEFEKPDDVAVFLNHELHVIHKEMAKSYVCNRVFLDYKET